MKSILSFLSVIALATVGFACAHSHTATVKGSVAPRFNNAQVLFISLGQGDTIGTTTVNDNEFTFMQEVVEPTLVQVRIGGRAAGNVILEPGVITFSQDGVSGTPLNDALAAYSKFYSDTYAEFNELSRENPMPEAEIKALGEKLMAYTDSFMIANIDNPVGASILLDKSYEMSLPELQELVDAHPSLKAYNKVNQIMNHKQLAAETSPGNPYKDFEIEYEGTTTKLSDLMQPGHYTLVDFWASWCGPCRMEIPVIKEILEEYGPKGLDVIGVAVWDEPDDTKKAIEELDITWPVMINARTIPTDLYGILGIPSIILIGPDGTIHSRDKQDEDLKADVASAMTKK